MTTQYKRILLKLSGESLMGNDPFGINRDTIMTIVRQVKEIADLGVQVGIVVGGGSDTDPDVWYYTDDHYESFCEIPDAEK